MKNIYVIVDCVSGSSSSLFTASSDEAALRIFASACANCSLPIPFMDDVVLKALGTFDVQNGEHILRGFEVGRFVSRASSPEVMSLISSFKEVSGSVEAAKE